MEKLGWDHECVHKDFAMEANDILRDLWNKGALDDEPAIKERVGKLLEIEGGAYTI